MGDDRANDSENATLKLPEGKTTRITPGRPLALLVSSGGGVALRPIRLGSLTIGRDPTCEVVLNEPSVSRKHARLQLSDTSCTLEDLGSSNGTSLFGQRLTPGTGVNVGLGDVFGVGTATLVLAEGGIPAPTPGLEPIVAEGGIVIDPMMQHLYNLLDVIAPTSLSILILGETGVGKEVYASTVHGRSNRRASKYLHLNCAALPESVLEGELFGYERGAFTGSIKSKAGLFESADKGTIFLDEIGDVPLSVQAKLLRALDSGEVLRVGSLEPRKVDVRFVSATNRDLADLIARGLFRSDLLFRLSGMTITLPPLRQRPTEIAPLAELFLSRATAAMGKLPMTLAPAALEALGAHDWPGNVRELRHVIERAAALCLGTIVEAGHIVLGDVSERLLPSTRPRDASGAWSRATSPGSTTSLPEEMRSLERKRITDALEKTGGNQSEAARLLGMSRFVLLHRLDAFGISRPRKNRR